MLGQRGVDCTERVWPCLAATGGLILSCCAGVVVRVVGSWAGVVVVDHLYEAISFRQPAAWARAQVPVKPWPCTLERDLLRRKARLSPGSGCPYRGSCCWFPGASEVSCGTDLGTVAHVPLHDDPATTPVVSVSPSPFCLLDLALWPLGPRRGLLCSGSVGRTGNCTHVRHLPYSVIFALDALDALPLDALDCMGLWDCIA